MQDKESFFKKILSFGRMAHIITVVTSLSVQVASLFMSQEGINRAVDKENGRFFFDLEENLDLGPSSQVG